ncbi:MAG: hypothetical protein WD021_04395 [Rhodothermales bacterium]
MHPIHSLIVSVRRAAVLLMGLACIVGLSACEEDVTAVTGTDLAYSLYGVVSPQLDTQWVRVFPIEGRLTPASPEPLDADLTVTNRTTGESSTMRDSIIADFAGQYAHVFWSPLTAEHEHTYRIVARRSDGAESSVEVTVPMMSEIVVEAPRIRTNEVVLPVLVPGDIPRVVAAEAVFAVSYLPAGAPEILTNSFSVPYYSEPHPVQEGWRVPIDLTAAFDDIRGQIAEDLEDAPLDSRVGVILLNVTARLIVANEAWNPPNGQFDAELIVQPGVMENVTDGFGFVGAGYRLSRQWAPPDTAVVRAGFRAPEDQ